MSRKIMEPFEFSDVTPLASILCKPIPLNDMTMRVNGAFGLMLCQCFFLSHFPNPPFFSLLFVPIIGNETHLSSKSNITRILSAPIAI